METHSSILAWKIPTDRGAWRTTVHGVANNRATKRWDLPGDPEMNPPSNAQDVGSIPGQGTKIPCALRQLRPHTLTTKPTCYNEDPSHFQLRTDAAKNK